MHEKPPIYISGFVGLNISEERAFPAAIKERLRSGQISVIIRNLLLDTKEKQPEKFERLVRRLVKDFDFRLGDIFFEPQSDLYVTANYEEQSLTEKKLSLDFTSSGSGFMQVLQILAPIYCFCPDESAIVLLDEPDAHLHPNLQAALANTLREIQKELNIQIIISTHSTTIIRAADPTEVIPISSSTKVNRPLVSSEQVESQIEERLDNSITTYDLGKSVISGKIIFFKDTDTSIIEAFDKAAGTKCFVGASTVPILKGRGKDDKIPFNLSQVIKELVGQEVEIHCIRDGDALSEEWRNALAEYANKSNVRLHHLRRHEIENYLLSPELIFRALSHKHPTKTIPSEIKIQQKIKQFLQDTIQRSVFNLNYNLEDSISKTAQLTNHEFRKNYQLCKNAASDLLKAYDKCDSFDDLVSIGMGKETLDCLIKWINQDLKLNFSKKDITKGDILTPQDVPDEIRAILEQLRSKATESQNIASNSSKEDSIDVEELHDDTE